MKVKWTPEVDNLLLHLWEAGHTDQEMAPHFNTTVFAVAKRRSLLGYCKHKRAHHKRRPKRILCKETNYVAMYTKDGRKHITFLANEREKALRMAQAIANQQLLREIYVLSPKYNIKRLTGKIVEFKQ